jgi:small subunit ribosomal protein S6
MIIIVPDITDEEVVEELGRINKYITDIGATIKETLTDSPWGRRRLAYTIRHNSIDYRDGYYVVYHFDSRPDTITDLERELKLDTRVIRYLLVHDDPKAGVQSQNNPDGETPEEAAPVAPVAAVVAPAAEVTAETPAAEVAESTTEAVADVAVEAEPATTEEPVTEEEAPEVVAEAPAEAVAEETPVNEAETSETTEDASKEG